MNKDDKLTLATQVIAASSSCKEFKDAAQRYINAVDTPNEAEAARALVAEAEEDISSIENTVEFFGTELAAEIFGEEVANEKLVHAKQIMDEGAVYCDCPGCTAAKEIINLKAEILN